MKINSKRELQNIEINYSADINYNDFMKIYRICTNKTYSFLTIDTTLPASDPLKFREKKFTTLIKITLIQQLKITDNKIEPNQAQYNLDRLEATISALSSGELENHEYLTGQDLGYRPSVFQKAKFVYSPLGKALSKGLKKDDKVKYNNNKCKYDFVHNFNKYNVTNVNEISSIDSKFDALNKFYKDFVNLKGAKSKSRETSKKNKSTKKCINAL